MFKQHFRKATALMLAGMLMFAAMPMTLLAGSVTAEAITRTHFDVTHNSAVVTGIAYTNPENRAIDWGIAYSTTRNASNPAFVRRTSNFGEEFEIRLSGLMPNRTYFYRAFIRYRDENNREQIEFGVERSFTTRQGSGGGTTSAAPGDPVINVPRITVVSGSEVTAESSFIAHGNHVRYAGFVFSRTNSNPMRGDRDTLDLFDRMDNEPHASFSRQLTRLDRDTVYYIRAYITLAPENIDIYSPVVTFTTSATATPEVRTEEVQNISLTGADVVIHVSGGVGLVERGVVFSSTDRLPELYSARSRFQQVSGTVGRVTVPLTGLQENVRYFARAYVRDGTDVFYGSVLEFTTRNAVTVTTRGVADVEATTAVALGTTDNFTRASFIEKGFVYSNTSATPTIHDNVVRTTVFNTGEYSLRLQGLNPGTVYHVRAFVRTDEHISYGTAHRFVTLGDPATVTLNFTLANGQQVSSQSINTHIGALIYAGNLNMPVGYALSPGDWSHTVETAVPVTVPVVAAANNATAFMAGVGQNMFAPDRAITRAEVAQAIFNLKNDGVTRQGMHFSDVPVHHQAREAIDFVSSRGYMRGDPGGTFRPNDTILRSEMTVVLSQVYNLQGAGSSSFPDVRPADWFYPFVNRAFTAGLVSGFPNGTFGPNRTTTRAETTVLLLNAERRTPSPLGTAQFVDVPTTHWAHRYVMSASIPSQGRR